EHRRQPGRIPAGLRGQLDADLIRLALLVTAVRRQHEPARQLADAAEDAAERRAHDAHDGARHTEEDRERRRGLDLAYRMASHHVTDLVAHDAGQLVLAV